MVRMFRFGLAVACTAVVLCAGRPAAAFDTQPHADMTADAMAAEGFGSVPIGVVQSANWFNDFYENPTKNPYSGHAPWYVRALGNPFANGENWSAAVRTAAARAHFDSDTPTKSTADMDAEWTRLAHVTRAQLLRRSAVMDIEGILAVMGISLHMVQDFYTHSNWVEPKGVPGYDGPGWSRVTYGTYPTWFDISPADRMKEKIYSDGARGHGYWKSDENMNLKTALNKDWAGRPLHIEAYLTAYVASRQWIRAMEAWIGNPVIWQKVKSFSDKHGNDMERDFEAAFGISFYSGHWNGNGEPAGGSHPGPGGSIDDVKDRLDQYFLSGKKSYFRAKWEQMIVEMDDRNPAAAATPVASSKDLRDGLDATIVEIENIKAIDSRDPLPGDEADWYMRARIDGQDYLSGFIHGYDSFDFTRRPYGAFTFIRVRPRNSGPVKISLGLYDDDSGPYGDDDHCDISPVKGHKDLEFAYDRATDAITGDIEATRRATVRGKGDGDIAEIIVRVRTLKL